MDLIQNWGLWFSCKWEIVRKWNASHNESKRAFITLWADFCVYTLHVNQEKIVNRSLWQNRWEANHSLPLFYSIYLTACRRIIVLWKTDASLLVVNIVHTVDMAPTSPPTISHNNNKKGTTRTHKNKLYGICKMKGKININIKILKRIMYCIMRTIYLVVRREQHKT